MERVGCSESASEPLCAPVDVSYTVDSIRVEFSFLPRSFIMSSQSLKDVLVVGAGPAGISCALALQQLGYTVVVIEGSAHCGGRLREFRQPGCGDGGATALQAAQALNIAAMGQALDVRHSNPAVEALAGRTSFGLVLQDGTVLGGRCLVLACGIAPRSGGLARRQGRIFGPDPLPPDLTLEDCSVAILGGGDSAFQSYLALKQAGAPRITIFARSLRARAQLVTAVPETDVLLGEYDVNPIHNEVNGRPYNLVHVCYGYEVPRRSLMGLMVGLSPEGLVLTDNHYETAVPGVFAIGDMAGKMRPSSAAAFAEGLIVAREIQRRLDSPVLQSLSERLTRSPARAAALDNH